MQDKRLSQLADLVRTSRRMVFFGGAGVSTESGIPDFRSAEGIFSKRGRIPPEALLHHSCLMADPESFYAFYRGHLLYPDAKPNLAHRTLAKWEKEGRLQAVVTQNIDGLHQAAGSANVYELHGSVYRNHCLRCGRAYGLDRILSAEGLPRCGCGGLIRPDVVLYGEGLDERVVSGAVRAIEGSDLVLIGGTSLRVYPAAGFVRGCPGKLAIINRDPTDMDGEAEVVITAPIGQTLAEVDRLLRLDAKEQV